MERGFFVTSLLIRLYISFSIKTSVLYLSISCYYIHLLVYTYLYIVSPLTIKANNLNTYVSKYKFSSDFS